MKRTKLIAILSIFGFVGIALLSSAQFSAKASGDIVLDEIAKYRDWTQIHKPDANIATGVFKITDSSVAGWSFVTFSPSLELTNTSTNIARDENDARDPVLKTLTKPGTRLIMPDEETKIRNGEGTSPRTFDTFRSGGSARKSSPHEVGYETFARVFANSLAESEIKRSAPNFPIGSIIVREKYLKEYDLTPETVTAMVKRQKGFSKKTNDWEFFTLNGRFLTVQKRETKGDCAKCHAEVKNTDFVFKSYLK